MLDLVYIGIFLVFLAVTIGFVAGCERLAPAEIGSKP